MFSIFAYSRNFLEDINSNFQDMASVHNLITIVVCSRVGGGVAIANQRGLQEKHAD